LTVDADGGSGLGWTIPVETGVLLSKSPPPGEKGRLA
jgi:hypothetical protein